MRGRSGSHLLTISKPSSDGYRCKFLGWIDPPMCARSMLIIPELLRNINNANYQVTRLKMCLFASWLLFVVACNFGCFCLMKL
uniref:Uncharacterized protein n=1 Tax=Lactuca sativa TaxID=4236 RepID=A0A9R1XSD7_LACSA|nr:hypothetical protein LSAT_V11C200089720 [Lactuca sativa]